MIKEMIQEPIEDCADLEGTQPAEIEKAYRRGYDQGAHAAFFLSSDEDERIWFNAVHEWRKQGYNWKLGEQVRVNDPLNPRWVRISMKEAVERWRKRFNIG